MKTQNQAVMAENKAVLNMLKKVVNEIGESALLEVEWDEMGSE